MIFIGGISSAIKQLLFSQMMVCTGCGRYGKLEVFMRYTYFSLFFIPVMKWGKEYYVKMNCCDKTFPINKALGRKIEQGESVTISELDF